MEKANGLDVITATIIRRKDDMEKAQAEGKYTVKCIDVDGNIKWEDTIDNIVCNQGKNTMLDAALAGSGYTATGPFMGLISNTAGDPVVGDTMASHGTWTECGLSVVPIYNGVRKTCVWNASASGVKALNASLNFVIETTGGTVRGCFIVFGTGAVSTKDNTGGSLYSAGLFSQPKVVGVGDTLQVMYTTSL